MFSNTWIRLTESWVMMKSSFTVIGISVTVVSIRSSLGSLGVPLLSNRTAGSIGTGDEADGNVRGPTSAPLGARPVSRSSPALKLLSSADPLPATWMFRTAVGSKSTMYCPAGSWETNVRVYRATVPGGSPGRGAAGPLSTAPARLTGPFGPVTRTTSDSASAPATADTGMTMEVVGVGWAVTSCGRSTPRMAASAWFCSAGLLPNSIVYGPDSWTGLNVTRNSRAAVAPASGARFSPTGVTVTPVSDRFPIGPVIRSTFAGVKLAGLMSRSNRTYTSPVVEFRTVSSTT